jgi:hypothetical protein
LGLNIGIFGGSFGRERPADSNGNGNGGTTDGAAHGFPHLEQLFRFAVDLTTFA